MSIIENCIRVDKKPNYISIIFQSDELSSSNVKQLQEEIVKNLLPFPGPVIINCENVTSFPKEWLRALLLFHLECRKREKYFKLSNVSAKLMTDLKMHGVDSTFKFAKDVKEALVELGIVQIKSLDTQFINPFLDATVKVLQIQAQVKCTPGQIRLKKGAEKEYKYDVSGVIGIISPNFEGSVVIAFKEATFLKIISNMLGETYTELTSEIADGAGELTNMIFGQAKTVLNELGYGINMAIPTVISGRDHSTNSLTSGPVIVVPFESSAGPFYVEICLSK